MKITTDVAIIGAGAAGLPAAYEAAQRGVKVAVFEREAQYGGACNGGNGVFAVESSMQDEMQLTYTKKEIFDYWMQFTHYSVNGALVSEFIDRSADTVDWLLEKGVIFDGVVAYFKGAYFVWHMRAHSSPTVTDAIMAHMPTDVDIHCKCAVRELMVKDGKVVGFTGVVNGDEELVVEAKAVILASGGLARNKALVKELTGVTIGIDVDVLGHPDATPEEDKVPCPSGYELAKSVGGKTGKVMVDQYAAMPTPYFGPGGTPLALGGFRQPQNILVNLLGERFMNEAEYRNGAFTANAIARQKGGTAFMLIDTQVKEYYEKYGWTYNISNPPKFDEPDFEGYFEKARNEGYPYLKKGASLDEIAEVFGINAENLKKTVSAYNVDAARGVDNQFYKDAKYLLPLTGPYYYVAQLKRGSYGVLGGMEINHRTEVLDVDDNIIPGLYGAGNDANSIYGYSYPFTLSGNTSSFAINIGRMAGEFAADYVKGITC